MQISRFLQVAIATAATGSGCTLLDDDEPPPIATAGGGTGDEADRSCAAEALREVPAACPYPQEWWLEHDPATIKAVMIDDPKATIGVGPGAWLVKVDSETDFVGTYHHVGEECDIACSWCQKGQNLCHGGFDEQGLPLCWSCTAYDDPNGLEACADLQAACKVAGNADEGLDETGADSSDGIGEHDCAAWRPAEGVQRVGDEVIVDAALVDEALLYQGEPLASCDDTRFRRRSDGYFELSRLADHGLLAAMGLSRGDVILAVDGAPLNDLDTVMQAASRLSTASSFTITISRAGERIVSRVVVR